MGQESDKMLNKWIKVLPWVCLIGLFCFLSVFMWIHGDALTDSDISSEMLLARILNEEHALISKNWFYSTELRVLNIQILYSFFFHFFHDWTMVRTGACIVSYLLMLVSYYYMIHQMDCDNIYAVSAVFLLLPISDGYFEYVLLALLYASFISISFFAVGLVFHYARASARMKKGLLVIVAALAFMAGLGGARHVVVLYLPLLAVTVLMALIERKPSGYLVCSAAGFAASCVGYLVNSQVLAGRYHFETWVSDMKFGVSVQGIMDLFFGTLRAFGYSYGDQEPTPAASAFSCVLALVMAVCVIRTLLKKWKEPDQMWLLTAYFLCVYGIFFCMYTFTDMLYSDRYNMAAMVFAIPIVVWNLTEISWNRYWKLGVLAFLGAGVLLGGVRRYARYGRLDKTAQLRPIVAYLEEENVSAGYATFWNANVLTELSDGNVDVWTLQDSVSDQYGVDEVLPWLQDARHLTMTPEGQVFLLFTEEEYAVSPLKEMLDQRKADYQSENYLLFLFDSYEEIRPVDCVF